MRTIIQRVAHASVKVEGNVVGKINKGLLILVGIEDADNAEDIAWLSGKIANLRIFDDAGGVMNLSLKDIDGEALVISQFTLHAHVAKGNRPSYIRASKPSYAIPMYEQFVVAMQGECNTKIQTGVFGADMQVELLNDGPVTIFVDSKVRE